MKQHHGASHHCLGISVIRWFGLIFCVALLVRAATGLYQFSRAGGPEALEFPDEQQYWLIARSLADGKGMRDELGFQASRMPLYPALLSLAARAPYGITVVRIAQWFVGAATAVAAACLAYCLTSRLLAQSSGLRNPNSPDSTAGNAPQSIFTAAPISVMAGFLVALDPFLALTSSLLLTETLYTFFQVTLWIVAVPLFLDCDGFSWKRWIALGLLAAACIYTRESAVLMIALLLVLLVGANRFTLRSICGGGLATMIVTAALLPWAWRNHNQIDEWRFLTTRAGISLYDGVRPVATGASDLGDVKQMESVRGLSETQWDRYFRDESLRYMKEDPLRILHLAPVKLLRTWNPLPNVESFRGRALRLVSAAWNLPLFALTGLGVIVLIGWWGTKGFWMVAYLLLPAMYVTVLHSLFVGSVRYRLVAMPMLEILAAIALTWILLRVFSRSRTAVESPAS